ncbi:hypothetical protein CGU37_29285 [Pseudomonas fluorescens]|nr:hypothetical protein CGU37_29285 [Pseudomonas fluorescens]
MVTDTQGRTELPWLTEDHLDQAHNLGRGGPVYLRFRDKGVKGSVFAAIFSKDRVKVRRERNEKAPIADSLCPGMLMLRRQLAQLKDEVYGTRVWKQYVQVRRAPGQF